MKVQFLDLSVSKNEDRKELLGAIDQVLRHGQIVLGQEVTEFEEKVAAYCGSKYAVGVNSGTDALFLGLKALDIGSNDEVITSSMSFVASANSIALTGATPVFADINDDLNMDPENLEALITSRTKVIMPVHYAGKIADMPAIQEIAERHGVCVVEDASQAFSAERNGQKAGTFGRIGCISLNPMKILAGIGEAGIVLTNDRRIKDKLIALRYNGLIDRQNCNWVSTNGRLDTIQAAILTKRLFHVEKIVKRRREIADFYNQKLKSLVECPKEEPGCNNVYYTYTVLSSEREKLKTFLESKDIEVKIYHPVIADEPAYKKSAIGKWNNARNLFKKKLALPCHEKLTNEEIKYVAYSVREFFNN